MRETGDNLGTMPGAEGLLCNGFPGTANYRRLEPRAESSTCVPVTTGGAAGTPDTGQLPGVGRGNSPAASRSVGGSKADREARNRARS